MLSGFPPCQLFEVHGSKFKPHPVGNLGQTTVVSIPHSLKLTEQNDILLQLHVLEDAMKIKEA